MRAVGLTQGEHMDKSLKPVPSAANENVAASEALSAEPCVTVRGAQITGAERAGLALLHCGCSFAEAEESSGVPARRLLALWLSQPVL